MGKEFLDSLTAVQYIVNRNKKYDYSYRYFIFNFKYIKPAMHGKRNLIWNEK